MKLVSFKSKNGEKAAFLTNEGIIPVESVARIENLIWPSDISTIIKSGKLYELNEWYMLNHDFFSRNAQCMLHEKTVHFAPLYRYPSKIFGIGLNYKEHAADLSEKAPEGFPGSFMKPYTTIIGPGDEIVIPSISVKTTGEAELCIVIGKECKNVVPGDWKKVVAGFSVIIDMTAEDMLRKNTRYLTLSKSFDTFLSFGYELITPDEIEDVNSIRVETVLNGKVQASNHVMNMTFQPDKIINILSGIMTLLPGDIILTGTPGSVQLNEGDIIEARINGFRPLINFVKDSKKKLTWI